MIEVREAATKSTKPFAKPTGDEGWSLFGDPHATTETEAVEETAPKLRFEQPLLSDHFFQQRGGKARFPIPSAAVAAPWLPLKHEAADRLQHEPTSLLGADPPYKASQE